MNNKVIVRFMEDSLMYEEELELLTSGACRSIFPLRVLHNDNYVTGCYHTSGYRRLSMYKELTAKNVLIAIENILTAVEDCRQYLIFPEEYILNINTTYIDEKFTKVKFTYIPDKRNINMSKKMQGILRELRTITTDNGKTYIDMLSSLCEVEELSYKKLKLVISRLIQEVTRLGLT